MTEFLKPEVCAACGGRCCKSMGCHLSPGDVPEVSAPVLRALLTLGHTSIDYWEGDVEPDGGLDRVYYLRMRNKGCPVCDPSWGGYECSLLGPTGCPLPFEQRPKGARMLAPYYDDKTRMTNCTQHYTKEDCAREWRKYNHILSKLWEEFDGR